MMFRNNFLRIVYILLILFIAKNCFAVEQNEKFWFGINAQQKLSKDKKWLSFIYTQARFINESRPFQSGLIEGGIGYRFQDNLLFWFGYRWSGHNPNNGFYQDHRLFQQVIILKKLANSNDLIFRTRIEELKRSDERQLSFRLRQRIGLEITNNFSIKAFPFFYDEIFVPLNKTNYTSNKFISQNRLFIGFNLYVEDKTWWEIGYINQFQLRTPLNNVNTMSHIASVTYNFS